MEIIPQNITKRDKKTETLTKKLGDLKEKTKSQVYLLWVPETREDGVEAVFKGNFPVFMKTLIPWFQSYVSQADENQQLIHLKLNL